MPNSSPSPSPASTPHSSALRPGWDALLLTILVFARLRVDSLAEGAVLPFRVQDVLRHPLLGHLLPPAGIAAMGDVSPLPGEPLALVLYALTLGFLAFYLLADLLTGAWRRRLKWSALVLILVTTLVLPTLRLSLLRQGSGPASYAHDGGVIQTESVVEFFVQGRNPYVEDYTETPMAEWGFSEYRTALYHYPYLPWTFVFSAPFYLMGKALGFYDQRLVYLLLFLVALALAPRLAKGERAQLGLVALLGLNPVMALDILFGQNDSFVLAWILLSLVAWSQWRRTGSTISITLSLILFGLACGSKPTAWFFAPFYGLLLLSDNPEGLRSQNWLGLVRGVPAILKRAWPALAVFALLVLPYLVWDASAFYDDVWRWSNGQGETGYQIWGWGAANFVLALGWVENRFAQWPFLILETLIALPVLLWLIQRQLRQNSLANACWHYGLFLLIFFYTSRFLNENYLGYILSFMAIGYLAFLPIEETV